MHWWENRGATGQELVELHTFAYQAHPVRNTTVGLVRSNDFARRHVPLPLACTSGHRAEIRSHRTELNAVPDLSSGTARTHLGLQTPSRLGLEVGIGKLSGNTGSRAYWSGDLMHGMTLRAIIRGLRRPLDVLLRSRFFPARKWCLVLAAYVDHR